jgi:MtrB/PioB family decaheme-associated outer membrane protein
MLSNTKGHKDLVRGFLVLCSLVIFAAAAAPQQPVPTVTPAATAASSPVETGEPKTFRYAFEAGLQFREANGDRPSKFEEYKSVFNAAVFRRFRFDYNPFGSPTFVRAFARNAGERDQDYYLEAGRYGRFRTTASWSSQPHLYSRGATSAWADFDDGVYLIPDNVQQALQVLDPPFTTATTTPNPALIAATGAYIDSVPRITVRSQRHTFSFEQEFDVTSNWSIRFRFHDYRRSGQRPLGTGSYERTGTAIGDTFRVHALELPAELDYRTDSFTFGTSYLTRHWGINFDYTFSKFNNGIEAYIYDNPFRITDQQATGGGNFNRSAFSRGLHSAYPDNKSHSIMISGFADLPFFDSRWAGAFGWSRWTQNEPFLPYTLNAAIVATNLGGLSPTDPASLPQESLEGEVENLTVHQMLSSRLTRDLTLNLHYRAYDYNNNTHEIRFPGYAAFLESFWRTSIAGFPTGTRFIENEPQSYLRQRASGELVWDLTRDLKWRGEYEWEGWNRVHRQAARTNEHKLMTSFSYRPINRVKLDLDYRYQFREPRAYDPGILEYSGLRMFDQATRIRHDIRFQMQWAIAPRLGFSGDFAYLSDDYDEEFFGTTRYIERRGGVELLYNLRENSTLYANYSREHYNTALKSIAKTGVPWDLRNRWDRNDRNINDNFGIGTTTYLMNSKLYLDAHYAFNSGRDLITTANPTQPAPSALLNAIAHPFPEAKYRYHEFTIDTNYQIRDKVAVGVRYYFEPFNFNDWQWNDLEPYPVDGLAPETDGRRFLLLDSRYTSHSAHIVSLYLRFGN